MERARRLAEDRTTASLPAPGAGLPDDAHIARRKSQSLAKQLTQSRVRKQIAPLEGGCPQSVKVSTLAVVEDRRIDGSLIVSVGVEEPDIQLLNTDGPPEHEPGTARERARAAPTFPFPGTDRRVPGKRGDGPAERSECQAKGRGHGRGNVPVTPGEARDSP